MIKNEKTRGLRASAAPLVLGLALFSAPALAQNTAPQVADEAAAEEDAIIVTGSRIVRPDLAASVPIATVSEQLIQESGTGNI